MLQKSGRGLTVAILLDALVIRCLIVPAVMQLLAGCASLTFTPRNSLRLLWGPDSRVSTSPIRVMSGHNSWTRNPG